MTISTDPDSSRTAVFRRRGMAVAMLVAPAFFVLANAAGALENPQRRDPARPARRRWRWRWPTRAWTASAWSRR